MGELWEAIREVVVKALLCVDGVIPHQPNAFELFGYDVIVDEQLRPWVLEVNASPAMARGTELDRRVKEPLIRDTLALVDPLPFDRAKLVQVIERRHSAHANTRQAQVKPTHKAKLARDLGAILGGRVPREVGQPPRFCGAYEPLAPGTPTYAKCMKIKAAVSRA